MVSPPCFCCRRAPGTQTVLRACGEHVLHVVTDNGPPPPRVRGARDEPALAQGRVRATPARAGSTLRGLGC
ncbi:hypothetical protein GCM10027091_26230 [Streptomyces daliensis]